MATKSLEPVASSSMIVMFCWDKEAGSTRRKLGVFGGTAAKQYAFKLVVSITTNTTVTALALLLPFQLLPHGLLVNHVRSAASFAITLQFATSASLTTFTSTQLLSPAKPVQTTAQNVLIILTALNASPLTISSTILAQSLKSPSLTIVD